MIMDLHDTYTEEHTIEARLARYETLAWKVIPGYGYPTTWNEFCEEFEKDSNHAEAVKIARAIFFLTQATWDQIKQGDAEGAALETLRLEHKAKAAKLMAASTG